jgi:quercetin dioxygenase-like cupin family protein
VHAGAVLFLKINSYTESTIVSEGHNMESEVVDSSKLNWEPVVVAGETIKGIRLKNLRFDETGKRPLAFLISLDAGASYPPHNLPGGDELFMLEGEVDYGKFELKKGDFLVTPPDANLLISSKTGCTMFYRMK